MNIFKKLAAVFVTMYANYLYKMAVSAAEARHAKEHRMFYVASENFRPNKLTIYDRVRFKQEKQVFGYHARLLTLNTLYNGCYYHTADRAGNQKMSKREKERRRLYFVQERLRMAKLAK